MFLILLTANVTPIEWQSDVIADQDSGAVLANGIIFNHVTKLSLAEKFINVDFLVPFPELEINRSAEIDAYIDKLGNIWSWPGCKCRLDYSSFFFKKRFY